MFRKNSFKNKKVLSMFLSLLLVLGVMVGFTPQTSFAEDAKTLTILHVNDVHGRIEYQDTEANEPSIGYAKLKTKLDQLKAENPNLLLLNAGDTLHGTVDINLSQGKAMVDLMNMVGFDAMTPGNHDFNYGYPRLLELKAMAEFPMLAANIEKEDGTSDFEGHKIFTMDNGLKVGIFGIATEETKYKSHPDNTKGINFTDYMDAAKAMVKKLEEEKVDVIVGLVHVGIDGESQVTTEDIAKEVDGIDLLVDGHSHTELPEGKMVNGTLIAQAGSYVRNIGMVELKFEDGKVSDKSASFFTVKEAADLEEDPQVKAKIDEIKAVNDEVKKEVIGKSKVDLVGERDVVRTGESTLGNVITDAMLRASGADVAITNGGGIRASIKAGDITLGDAMTAFPFTNFLSTIEVTGADILEALEFGVDEYPKTAGKFPHVAGMKYKFDPNKPAGKKILEVKIDGKDLVKEKLYSIVTNDFMAIGGDGYTVFGGKKIIAEGALLSDVLIDYLKEEGEINPTIEGRITLGKGQLELTRLAGYGRVETAIEVSKEAYKNGRAKTAVIAGYSGQADALTGTVLAKLKNAPLLITNKNNLGKVKEELSRLGAEKVYVLGGEMVISAKVETQLKDMGIEVKRLAGDTRVETAVKIAEESFGEVKPLEAFIIEYSALADASAIGPVAAMKNAPILITHKDKLPKETKAVLESFELKDLTIVGGENVVSKKGQLALEELIGKDVDRVYGKDRLATSLEIAKKYFENPKALIVTSGYAPHADALAGGYFANKIHGPIILSKDKGLSIEALEYIKDKNLDTYILGGEKAISEKAVKEIKDALEGKMEGAGKNLEAALAQ